MLFNNDLVIYVTSRSLQIFSRHLKETLVLEFPDDVVRYSELVDAEAFNALLFNFLTLHKLKSKRAYVVIGGQLVFEKEIPITKGEDQKDLKDTFFRSVPFDSISLVKKEVWLKDKIVLVATHGEFLREIVGAMHRMGMHILGIAPAFVFTDLDNLTVLDAASAKNVLHKRQLFKDFNLLLSKVDLVEGDTVDNVQEIAEKPKKKVGFRQYLLLFVSLVFVAGSVIFALVSYEIVSLPWQDKSVSDGPVSGILEEKLEVGENEIPAETAVKEIDVSKLQVRVDYTASESGVLLRKGLEEIGFEKITMNEVKVASRSSTIVRFREEIPLGLRDEVVSLIEENFIKAEQDQGTLPDDVDVQLVLGDQK